MVSMGGLNEFTYFIEVILVTSYISTKIIRKKNLPGGGLIDFKMVGEPGNDPGPFASEAAVLETARAPYTTPQ